MLHKSRRSCAIHLPSCYVDVIESDLIIGGSPCAYALGPEAGTCLLAKGIERRALSPGYGQLGSNLAPFGATVSNIVVEVLHLNANGSLDRCGTVTSAIKDRSNGRQ